MKVEWEGEGQQIEIEADRPIGLDSSEFREFIRALWNMGHGIALASLSVTHDDSDDWNYTWTTSDGRSWAQVLRVTESATLQSFTVGDFFALDEFRHHREVRDRIDALIRRFGVSKIEVTWAA